MRVKTFQGRTLEEVLPQVRHELGPEAVVLSQRPLISGGVGGLFGKRMVEVTAADRMPSDEELLDLEQDAGESTAAVGAHSQAAPMQMAGGGSVPGLDLVDEWDPAADEELAAEFGSVLQRVRSAAPDSPPQIVPSQQEPAPAVGDAAPVPTTAQGTPNLAGTYQPLNLPRRSRTVDPVRQPQPVERDQPQWNEPVPSDPLDVQARQLAERAHQAIAAATREIERQLTGPQDAPEQPGGADPFPTSTFRAEVLSAPAGPRVGFPHPAQAAARDLLSVAPEARPEPAPMRVDQSGGGKYLISSEAPRGPSVAEQAGQLSIQLADDLAREGVERDIADVVATSTLLHRMPFVGQSDVRSLLREVVAEHVPVATGWPPLGNAHKLALVGPSGAGKSTIAAKLAEGYGQGCGLKVAVISILAGNQGGRPAVTDPLLGRPEIELIFVSDVDQMVAAMQRVTAHDLVIIDTPSAAYLDRSAYTVVAACLAVAKVDDVKAVIPLATSLREAESVIDHFRPMSVNRLVVSKLDESRYAGQLLNFGYRLGLPITFLSDGPAIPEDLRAASAQEIATLIVPHGDASQPTDRAGTRGEM